MSRGIIAPARSAGASYSRPGLLNDLVYVRPKILKFCAEGAKFTRAYEGTSKFQKKFKTPNGKLYMRFSEIYRIEEAPASMLTGIELFQHRFSGNPENQCFFWNQEDWTVSRFPVFGPFLATFFQKVLHRVVLRENTGCKLPNCMWGKFCAEGAKFFDRHTEKCRPRRRPRGQAGATLALRVLSSNWNLIGTW